MNVSLTVDLETFVREQIESGRYKSASEAVRDGLRMLKDQVEREKRSREMRELVTEARALYDSQGGLDAEAVFRELEAKQRERRRRT